MNVIRYFWIWPGGKIEMAGRFTPERWEQFCRKPHPCRNDVSIERITVSSQSTAQKHG